MKIEIDFFAYVSSIKLKNEGQIVSYFDPTNKHEIYTKDKRRKTIFDPIRNKYIELEKEELVRQLVLQYFLKELKYPMARFGVEKRFKINKLFKRSDILIYDRDMAPFILVECKAPNVDVDKKYFGQKALDQIGRYNLNFKVQYLIVTNGMTTYCSKVDYHERNFTFIDKIPSWNEF